MFNANKIKRNWKSNGYDGFLTFTANAVNSTVKLASQHKDTVVYNGNTYNVSSENKAPYLISLQYSTNGINWNGYQFTEILDENDNVIGYDGETITLHNIGDYVIIRANNDNYNLHPNGGWNNWYPSVDSEYLSPTGWYQFVFGGSVSASGNIQSLATKTNTYDKAHIGMFYRLFKDCTQMTSAPYIGATKIENRCYEEMFYGCTNIGSIEIETNLYSQISSHEFDSMCEGCSNLTDFNDITIKSVANGYGKSGFNRMFYGCSSLSRVPNIKTEYSTVGNDAYVETFHGCSSITDASEFIIYPSYNAEYHKGDRMFESCSSLTNAPFLSDNSLYYSSSGNGGSSNVFSNCKSLKEIVYVDSNLPRYDASSSAYTYNWVSGVSSNGVFFKNSGCPTVYSNSFIPYGWDINDIDDRPLCFETETVNNRIMLGKIGEPFEWKGLQYSTDGNTWKDYEFNTWVSMPNIGDKAYFRTIDRSNSFKRVFRTLSDRYYFRLQNTTTARAKCSGNLFTIIRYLGTRVDFNTNDNNYLFSRLFQDCKITTTPDIPDIPLPKQALTYTFIRTAITELVFNKKSQLQIGGGSPFNEFGRDIQTLTSAKIFIRNSQLIGFDMYHMFYLSANLARIETYLDNWTIGNHIITSNWVEGVTNQNGVFVCPKTLEEIHDESHIPIGWTVKRWYQEMGEQYTSVAQMMQQPEYAGLEDVVDTYPNVAAILDQYPNLVHSLINTGYRPYVTFGTDMWNTDIYPHQYMTANFKYNRVSSTNEFGVFAKNETNPPIFSLYQGVDKVQYLFGMVEGNGNNPQGLAQYGVNGEHEMYLSRSASTFDGTAVVEDTQIKRADFDSSGNTQYFINPISIKGTSGANGTTTDGKFYSLEINEFGIQTHHFVPIDNGTIADIQDLDEIKVYTKDDVTSIFGLEQIS
jgi:hypothetical protein